MTNDTDDMQTRISRSVACLTLGAVGDALGAPIEFLKLEEIREALGLKGLEGYEYAYGVLGPVTDDTQMTLFAAESLINAHIRGKERGVLAEYWTYTARSYVEWLTTQGRSNPAYAEVTTNKSDLQRLVANQGQRAPGSTCISALATMKRPPKPATNDSKGCGTVMRVAPVGIFFGNLSDVMDDDGLQYIYDRGAEDARITHGHPAAADASGVLACIIALCLRGSALRPSAEKALALSKTAEVKEICNRVLLLADQPLALETYLAIGEGWVAEEALAMSLYCALQWENDELDAHETMLFSVNHDGDSDSTGAITGNLIGAAGAQVPKKLLDPQTEAGSLVAMIRDYGERLITVKDYTSR